MMRNYQRSSRRKKRMRMQAIIAVLMKKPLIVVKMLRVLMAVNQIPMVMLLNIVKTGNRGQPKSQ
eukprot:5200562-Ditylum_brightwellii.AAC.1